MLQVLYIYFDLKISSLKSFPVSDPKNIYCVNLLEDFVRKFVLTFVLKPFSNFSPLHITEICMPLLLF